MKTPIICALLVLALASLACGFNIDLPQLPQAVTPGAEQTMNIETAVPASAPAMLQISFGAGELHLAPGAAGKLVQGTAVYNLEALKPTIVENGSQVEIKNENFDFKNFIPTGNFKNTWDLKLGSAPMELSIAAGAYDGTMSFGGLALQKLTIKDGAAQNKVSFDAPNAAEMSELRYETGASSVTLTGLGNANFASLVFKSGAGNYELDFSGSLKRDATVKVESGLSDMTLRIPAGVNAVVTMDGGLTNVTTSSGWAKSDNTYTQAGSGPTLTISVEMGAGNLTLTD